MAFFNKNKPKFEMPVFDPSTYQSEGEGEKKDKLKSGYVPPGEASKTPSGSTSTDTAAAGSKPPAETPAPPKPEPPNNQQTEAAAEARAGRISALFARARQELEPAASSAPSSAGPQQSKSASPAVSPSAGATATNAPSARPLGFSQPPVQQTYSPELRSSPIRVEMKPEATGATSPTTASRENSTIENSARVQMKLEESRPAPASPAYRPMESAATTISIDKNSKFSGHLKFAGTIAVDGAVEGEVVAEKLVVHDGGSVTAKVESDTVMIAGTVKGDVFAKKEVEVSPSGTLTGNVTAPALLIRPGGCFEGKCTIGRRN